MCSVQVPKANGSFEMLSELILLLAKDHFLLDKGTGADDLGYIHIDKKTGLKKYPPQLLFQIAQYLSERSFAVLRYDKRGVGENFTILNPNVWGILLSMI